MRGHMGAFAAAQMQTAKNAICHYFNTNPGNNQSCFAGITKIAGKNIVNFS